MPNQQAVIGIFGDDGGYVTAALTAIMARNAAHKAQSERLKSVMTPVTTLVDPFTEHDQLDFGGKKLDQKSFDQLDPQSQPMQTVPRRGVGPTSDA